MALWLLNFNIENVLGKYTTAIYVIDIYTF